MKLTVRRLEAEQLDEIRTWYDDAELARRLTHPTDEWYAAISAEGQQCWVVLDDSDTPVAKMQVDREGDVGYIALAVKPELRGCGIGSAALSAFITGPGRQYSILEGRIEPDNAASIACVQKCGFRMLDELDDDGFMIARWHGGPLVA
jgi:RimJ/RimL family protein N-acetyltransferase